MIPNVIVGLALAGAGFLKVADTYNSREHKSRVAYLHFIEENYLEQHKREAIGYSGNDMFTHAHHWLTDTRWFLGLRGFLKYKTQLVKEVVGDNMIPLALLGIGLTVAFPGMWPLLFRFGGGFMGKSVKILGAAAGQAARLIPKIHIPVDKIIAGIGRMGPLGGLGILGGAAMGAVYWKTLMGEFTGYNEHKALNDHGGH